MDTTHEISSIKLTSSEIAELFLNYISDSAAKCVLLYYANTVKDSDIYDIVKMALEMSETHLKVIREIFSTIDHPIPHGFDDADVNVNANTLFSDTIALRYIERMAAMGLKSYAEALTVSAREDVRNYYTKCMQSTIELLNKSDDILLAKGLFIRSPYIEVPREIEFAKKQSYFHGLLGDKRTLNAQEINQIYINLQTNILGKAFILGLSQTAESKRVKEYLFRGKEIAEKHVNVFSDMLEKEDLPAPMLYDAEVSNSTEQVFSDRLAIFHVSALIGYGASLYGDSMSKIMRTDVIAAFARLTAEIAQYAKDGLDIMLDNEWLERIPETVNRKELVEV